MPMPHNVVRLREMLCECTLCPRACRVNRLAGRLGACRTGPRPLVASAGPHFGEEPALVGQGGSGTIFFCGCNLDCVFCQNFDLSHGSAGRPATPEQLARIAIDLQRQGCANINFVTPTHVAHAVAEAIILARRAGLTAPVVYNCGGYESPAVLRLLDGLVEIYMPDFKWADAEAGKKYSGADDYPAVAEAALAEMFRQVGALQISAAGLAIRGLLVRHLVMPGDLAKSRKVIETIARVAPSCAINVMGQYRPAWRAGEFPDLSHRPDPAEIRSLREYAASLGLVRAD